MERPQTVECALFDCDGVLADSEPVAARINCKVYNALGIPATVEDCLWLCGRDVVDVPHIAANYGIELSVEEYKDKFMHMRETGEIAISTYAMPELKLMEGVRDVLARLRAAGVLCGLVSTTVSFNLLYLLNRYGLVSAFDAIVAGDMVKNHKPHPEPYQKAMDILGVAPEHTIIFEDSPLGISAGVASGAYVFGFQGSVVQQDVSQAHEPLACYADFDLV